MITEIESMNGTVMAEGLCCGRPVSGGSEKPVQQDEGRKIRGAEGPMKEVHE